MVMIANSGKQPISQAGPGNANEDEALGHNTSTVIKSVGMAVFL